MILVHYHVLSNLYFLANTEIYVVSRVYFIAPKGSFLLVSSVRQALSMFPSVKAVKRPEDLLLQEDVSITFSVPLDSVEARAYGV